MFPQSIFLSFFPQSNFQFLQQKNLCLWHGHVFIMIMILFCSREKPGDDEWHKLEDMKTPFLLNFSQCKLSLGEYYPVIEHTTTVLKREPGTNLTSAPIKSCILVHGKEAFFWYYVIFLGA